MSNKRLAVPLFLITVFLLAPNRLEGQIGGLIKKKVGEAVKGGDKKEQTTGKSDAAVEQSGNAGSKLPMKVTPNTFTAFRNGLKAERDHREGTVKFLASLKTREEYNACARSVPTSPEAQKLVMAVANLPANASMEQVQKATETMQADMVKLVGTKCGESPTKYEGSWRSEQMVAAEVAGVKAFAAGLGPASGSGPFLAFDLEQGLQRETDFYRLLKEWIPPFCKLSNAARQAAAEKGISIPGSGKGIAFVYTADEARLLMPYCEELMALLSVLQ